MRNVVVATLTNGHTDSHLANGNLIFSYDSIQVLDIEVIRIGFVV